MKRAKGFTLIELMIVVAIIGILSSFALTAYQQYLARTQASEALELMGSNKVTILEWYNDKGYWPTTGNSVLQATHGQYVRSITLASSGTSVFSFVSTMKAAGSANSLIADKTVELKTEDGGKTWNCQQGAVNPIPAKYLPSVCQ